MLPNKRTNSWRTVVFRWTLQIQYSERERLHEREKRGPIWCLLFPQIRWLSSTQKVVTSINKANSFMPDLPSSAGGRRKTLMMLPLVFPSFTITSRRTTGSSSEHSFRGRLRQSTHGRDLFEHQRHGNEQVFTYQFHSIFYEGEVRRKVG